MDELPRNATGKILKKELKEREEGENGAGRSSKNDGRPKKG